MILYALDGFDKFVCIRGIRAITNKTHHVKYSFYVEPYYIYRPKVQNLMKSTKV